MDIHIKQKLQNIIINKNMYQINHTKGNLIVATEQEALERAKEFKQVIITKFEGRRIVLC